MAQTSLKYFTQVLSVIAEFNLSEDDCLSAVGLSEMPKSDRVNAETLAHILNFAAERLNEPKIGIECGLKYPILQYTRPAEFLKLCENLSHAADLYNRYCPLFHTLGTPSGIVSEEGSDRMIWVPNFEPDLTETYRHFIEFIMINLVTSLNWLAWKTPHAVQQVNIMHPAILPITEYEALFGCDVKFGQAEYSVMLKEGVKDAPFSMSDQAALTKICMKYDMALNELYAQESLIDRIELQIRRTIEHGDANKASVAQELGFSERSLARALKDKDTNFKDIKSRIIKDMAVAMINDGRPLVEIAHALGYNDQPAFTRAYKKWFGHPPGQDNPSRR